MIQCAALALSLAMHDSEPLLSNTQLLLVMVVAFVGGLVAPLLLSGAS